MTFIFEVATDFFNLVQTGQTTFDILQFGPRVATGDTVIYQELPAEQEDNGDSGLSESDEPGGEISVTITTLFDDTGKALKKGFTAFQFKTKE